MYVSKAQRAKRREEAKAAGKGIGNPLGAKNTRSFWGGVLFGAATATGGYFAIKALEKAFKKDPLGAPGVPMLNPGDETRAKLLAVATGQPMPVAAPAPTPTVTKRTIIEEMVEDLD